MVKPLHQYGPVLLTQRVKDRRSVGWDKAQVIPGRLGRHITLDLGIRHHIEGSYLLRSFAAAEKGQAVIEQRRKAQRFFSTVPQDLDICPMPVTVQDKIVHDQHLIDEFCPAVPSAEVQRRFPFGVFCFIVGVKGDLALSRLLEILGGA